MGLFDFIFRKSIKRQDDFFGKMKFIKFKKNPQNNYFECSRNFKPSGTIIEIAVVSDLTSPLEKQKEFFKHIESEYQTIIRSIQPLIEDEFQNWKENFKIVNFSSEFKPVYLHLSRFNKEPKIWEIVFETEHDLNHNITITMEGFEAKEILIDG